MKRFVEIALVVGPTASVLLLAGCTVQYAANDQSPPRYGYYAPATPTYAPRPLPPGYAPAPVYAPAPGYGPPPAAPAPEPVYAPAPAAVYAPAPAPVYAPQPAPGYAPSPPPGYAPPPPPPPAQVVYYQLDAGQIDQLTGPVALYPDPLLAALLPASTYPQDVVAAAQWLAATPQPAEQDIDAQSWDPSVKAMVHYPTVLQMMNSRMDWTQALGAAFANQPQDVMNSIQRLRGQAAAAGALASNQQQQVVTQPDGMICVLPAAPQVVYVPVYDPRIVYVVQPRPPVIVFGAGLVIGQWMDYGCDWPTGNVVVGARWDRGWSRRDGSVHLNDDDQRHDAPRRWARDSSRPLPVLPPKIARQAKERGARPQVIQQKFAQPLGPQQGSPDSHRGGTHVMPAAPARTAVQVQDNEGGSPSVDRNHEDRHVPPPTVVAPAAPPAHADSKENPFAKDSNHSDKHAPPKPSPASPPVIGGNSAPGGDDRHADNPAPPKHKEPAAPAPVSPPKNTGGNPFAGDGEPPIKHAPPEHTQPTPPPAPQPPTPPPPTPPKVPPAPTPPPPHGPPPAQGAHDGKHGPTTQPGDQSRH